MHSKLLDRILETAFLSGGCIKFDLKAWNDPLHQALTGVTNRRTLENFARAGKKFKERPTPPLLLANTLLVPGYIDEKEVSMIAKFVASVDPHIPYSLLAFYPQFYMSDLPVTPKRLAETCLKSARQAGLKNVRLGNLHLLR
jgi:pyruvate formate lyase activating enzyme